MDELMWPIDFKFHYPENCSRKDLKTLLEIWASEWPGWDNYPWRVTRNIHRFVDQPPLNFLYVLIHRCVGGQAAALILNADFEDRKDVLDMMRRESFQFIGIFRVLLIDALRYEMRFTKREYILDCTGPEEGHEHHSAEELKERRRAFRESVAGAEKEFVRILNLASQTDDMDEWILGKPLRSWAKGGDLPVPVAVPVRVNRDALATTVLPRKEEAKAIIKTGKKLPRLVLRKNATGDQCPAEAKAGKAAVHVTASPNVGSAERQLAVSSGGSEDGEPAVKVIGDFKVIRVGGVDVNLSRKHKARGFLRFVHEKIAEQGTRDFYAEEMRDAFNAVAPANKPGRRWVSDRLREDLFKGMEQFDLLFDTLDKSSGHYRLKF